MKSDVIWALALGLRLLGQQDSTDAPQQWPMREVLLV
jgi:hypothetical protein